MPATVPPHVHRYGGDRHSCAVAEGSLKHVTGCGPALQPAMQLRVLITGVQRSGTHFAWEMLNRLGVHVHHEGLGPDGAVAWPFSWLDNAYSINANARLTRERFCIVLHQVRHPLRTVNSIVKAYPNDGATGKGGWDSHWAWLAKMEPDAVRRGDPVALRAAKLWIAQNEKIEQYADARFRSEETGPREVRDAAACARPSLPTVDQPLTRSRLT